MPAMHITLYQLVGLVVKLLLAVAVGMPLYLVFAPTVIAQGTPHPCKNIDDRLNDQTIQQRIDQPQLTLQSFQKASALYQEGNNRGHEDNALRSISIVYRDLEQAFQALNYYQQIFTVAQSLTSQILQEQFFNNIGEMHYGLRHYSKVTEDYQQAIATIKAVNDQVGEPMILSNIRLIYRGLTQYPQAIDYIQRSLVMDQSAGEELILRKLASGSTATCSFTPYRSSSTAISPDNRHLISLGSR